MPDVRISIGGRNFEVSCQPGEESFLSSAAGLLDIEATALQGQIGRLPEARMLLMAGLMLADKTAGLEERLQATETALKQATAELEQARANPQRVEVPVIPASVSDSLAEIAARAESMAAEMEEKAAG
ncbi:cell division protein ZapA [Actibacterium ureilyticum]|uniref:cell division protein ZapA n=1 Tax=Actibacterium ureilyticum TaxID=1590614 RepID=UPI000BAA9829|nr:cell division protein ZapA [Actibacterium ureilyticum]